MKGNIRRILFILTAVVVLLPLVQQHLHIFPFRPLRGVVTEPEKPTVNLPNFVNQKYQQWVEKYLKLHFGFREPLTRWYNQYLYDCYDMSILKKNNWIYISDDGWFYEAPYMEEYYRGKARYYSKDSLDMAEQLGAEALRLYQLQHILEESGTHLFVMLLPGKELIYPEHIPETDYYPGEKYISAWEFYSQRLQELGVNHINVGQWFLDMKDSVDYPLYPQTGIHWSDYAAMHVADSLIRYMEQLGNKRIQHFTIGPRYEKTVYPDDDLEQVMNLIRPLPKQPNYQAKCTILEDSTADRPLIITIGDSYYWNILNATPFSKIMGGTPYWYYYNTVYFDDPHRNISEIDVTQQVLDADYVMLSYSTPNLYKMSQGFSQQVLLDICCDQEDLTETKQQLVDQIRNNPSWMETLVKNAELYNLSIDSVLNEEAEKSLLKRPELFVPALKDSIPTHRSQKYNDYIKKINKNTR